MILTKGNAYGSVIIPKHRNFLRASGQGDGTSLVVQNSAFVMGNGCNAPVHRGATQCRFYHPVRRPVFVSTPRARTQGGAGLGLALCKGIVNALGGVFVIESVVDAGTTVTLRLPQQTTYADSEPDASHSPAFR